MGPPYGRSGASQSSVAGPFPFPFPFPDASGAGTGTGTGTDLREAVLTQFGYTPT
jgi:hypothetical protein